MKYLYLAPMRIILKTAQGRCSYSKTQMYPAITEHFHNNKYISYQLISIHHNLRRKTLHLERDINNKRKLKLSAVASIFHWWMLPEFVESH